MDLFIARQPIFLRNKQVAAYELLFRDSMDNFFPEGNDADIATSSVLSSIFMDLGIDAVSGGKKVFINFSENLLLKQLPSLFPPERTIVEILESVKPTPGVITACHTLKEKGYTFALDDFIFDKEMEPFFEIADIIKIDFREVPLETIKIKISSIPRHITLLAEKVETWEEFNAGIEMGFILFQGYFFCKPQMITGKKLSASLDSLIQIVAETNKSDPDTDKIVSLVSKDVTISYKLLSLINSAYFKRLVEIESVKQALYYLGQYEFKRFISVILMSNIAKESTMELAVLSCLRARFCELIGGKVGDLSQEAFTVGLFSLLDAMLGKSVQDVMDLLPLSSDIKKALIDKEGVLYKILEIVVAFEKGDFQTADINAEELNLDNREIPKIYKDSVEWADIYNPA